MEVSGDPGGPPSVIKPAAFGDADQETRTTAKWVVAAFAGVGGVLLSGIGLSSLGNLEGERLGLAAAALTLGIAAVVLAVYLAADVLTPTPVTLNDLASFERGRNSRRRDAGERSETDAQDAKRDPAAKRHDELVAYVESDPSLLQGIVDREKVDSHVVLIAAQSQYLIALDESFRATNDVWDAEGMGAPEDEIAELTKIATAANSKVETIHWTVRRLETISSATEAMLVFKRRRLAIAGCALLAALSIGAFAWAGNPPEPARADLRGATLEGIDLSGASLREANLEGMTIRAVDLTGTNLEGAAVDDTTWKNTICPDGTNSDNAGETCAGHLSP
jgi:hypothetical protein